MAALAICAVTAALLRRLTDTQAPPPLTPEQLPPPSPGMVPLTVPQVKHLLAAGPTRHPPGHADRWLDWKRLHQAHSRWYHRRTRLARDTAIALVSSRMETAELGLPVWEEPRPGPRAFVPVLANCCAAGVPAFHPH
jgi:hypothetical protein